MTDRKLPLQAGTRACPPWPALADCASSSWDNEARERREGGSPERKRQNPLRVQMTRPRTQEHSESRQTAATAIPINKLSEITRHTIDAQEPAEFLHTNDERTKGNEEHSSTYRTSRRTKASGEQTHTPKSTIRYDRNQRHKQT